MFLVELDDWDEDAGGADREDVINEASTSIF